MLGYVWQLSQSAKWRLEWWTVSWSAPQGVVVSLCHGSRRGGPAHGTWPVGVERRLACVSMRALRLYMYSAALAAARH